MVGVRSSGAMLVPAADMDKRCFLRPPRDETRDVHPFGEPFRIT